MRETLSHDPSARLDYRWDWAVPDSLGRTWLDGDTILAATVTATLDGAPAATVTVEPATHDDTTVSAWVSGGTVGTTVALTCRITTAAGRIDDRTLWLRIRQR